MSSKLLVCLLLGAAGAVPQGYDYRQPSGAAFGGGSRPGAFGIASTGTVVPILVDERQGPDARGVYSFNYKTGDGISRQEQGNPQGPEGAVVQNGEWTFSFPDGTPADFKFVADENGFRVQSDLLPTPPPLPPHAIAQIEKARQEDAAAATSGNRGSYNAPSALTPQFSGQSPSFSRPSAPSSLYGAPSASASQFAFPSAQGAQVGGRRPAAPSRSYGLP